MEIIRNTEDFFIKEGTAVCIGKFDGVHLGHQRLLEHIVAKKAEGLKALVFTFNPTPEELLFGKKNESLCRTEEKEKYFEDMGIDIVLEYPLTLENAGTEARAFVENILIDRLNMKYIAAGSDISFGKGGMGNRALIEEMSLEYGFECDIIEKVRMDGVEISSSAIRAEIAAGNTEKAIRMLGRKK